MGRDVLLLGCGHRVGVLKSGERRKADVVRRSTTYGLCTGFAEQLFGSDQAVN